MAMMGASAGLGFQWSDEQRSIVAAPVGARFLVEAGPGTGKTAVACGRIAWLIDSGGVLGHEVLMISFTRTAIAELRDRIEAMSQTHAEVLAVRLSTIDSHAWSLRHGFESEEAKLLGGAVTFDANIERALGLLRARDPQLIEFLAGLRHVLIDEAQDVIGDRADFIIALLEALDPAAGITIFADPAQAIYGWSAEDDDAPATARRPSELVEVLKNGRGAELKPRALGRVFRTEDKGLLGLLDRVRKTVLKFGPLPRERFDQTREQVAEFGTDDPPYASDLLREAPNSLVLYRRRVEVLQQAGFLTGPFRLRMSRLPCCIEPWVGHLLCEETGSMLARPEFEQLWQRRHRPSVYPHTRDESWALLRELAPDGAERVSLRKLRSLLGRAKPPSEVCSPDVGTDGPILGTIHASKGREADSVILALPHASKQENPNWDEESRVLYVGASRARERLTIAKSGSAYAGYVRGERVYQVKAARRVQVHIGLDGDVDVTAHVRWDNARVVQERLAKLAADPPSLIGCHRREWDHYRYRLFVAGTEPTAADNIPVGQLDERVNSDLWEIARERGKGQRLMPPSLIPWLRMLAVRTICIGDDYDERLRPPYRESRFFLAPVVHGYPTLSFTRWNSP
jgi:hypothetical protein